MQSKLTLVSVALMFSIGQAYAHTGVRDVVMEGSTSYNGFTITHGCGGDDGEPYPVIGQSAVFPFGDDVVWRDGSGAVLQEGGDGNATISSSTGLLSLAPVGYAGFQSPFVTSQEIIDDLYNVRGLLWKDGAMEPKLNAITPFRISAPTIANDTVKCLKIRVGVINYCDKGKNEANDANGPWKAPTDAFGRKIPFLTANGETQTNVNGSPVYKDIRAGNGDNNRQDWWFTAPYGGSAYYQDIDLLQPTYWTTINVLNTSAGATVTDCSDAASTVSVEPTGAAFDAILTPANTKPFSNGSGPQ